MIVSIDIYTYLITTLIGREQYNIECTVLSASNIVLVDQKIITTFEFRWRKIEIY